MSKKSASIFKILEEKGYKPQVNGNDIIFNVEGHSFIFQSNNDPFYIIMLPNIYHTNDESQILEIINLVNKLSLVAKIVVHEGQVHVASQAIYPDIETFELMLDYLITACTNCAHNFFENLKHY